MSSFAKRDKSIDFIKGIAIFSVVLAHCWFISDELFEFIYSFHMPLFFCISGYLFNTKKKYGELLISKIKTLIIPYILFFVFSFIVSVFILDRDVTILEGLSYMLQGGKFCSRVCNWPLWYLLLFFIASNIFYFIVKIRFVLIRYMIMSGLFVASLPIQNYCNNTFTDEFVPFAFNALCPALFFMLVAFEFKIIKNNIGSKINVGVKRILTPITTIGLFMAGLILAAGNTDQIIRLKSYAFLIYPLLLIPLIVLVCQGCQNKYIVHLGNNSLIILGTHRVLIFVLTECFQLKKVLDYLHISSLAGGILVSCFTILVICVTKELICAVIKLCKKSSVHKSKHLVKNTYE